ncbi:MAG: addiction module protein [Gemmataceae bacterium]|nr:addiction module protein [Gemmataceae bacterium]
MTEAARAILEAARRLDPDDQILVAEALLKDTGFDFVPMTDEQFAAELERRSAEMDQGIDPGIPWETLRDEK